MRIKVILRLLRSIILQWLLNALLQSHSTFDYKMLFPQKVTTVWIVWCLRQVQWQHAVAYKIPGFKSGSAVWFAWNAAGLSLTRTGSDSQLTGSHRSHPVKKHSYVCVWNKKLGSVFYHGTLQNILINLWQPSAVSMNKMSMSSLDQNCNF